LLQPSLEQATSIQEHYAVETYYTPYAILQSILCNLTAMSFRDRVEDVKKILIVDGEANMGMLLQTARNLISRRVKMLPLTVL